MGTSGTLVVGYEGETLLFGKKGDSIDVPATDSEGPRGGKVPAAASKTSIDLVPKTGNAVLQASESRVADAAGGRTGPGSRVGTEGEADRLLPYRTEIATFCAAIRAGAPLRCGVDMAFKTTAACLAANEAMDTKTHVAVAQQL
jgi:hypothetical protein